MIIAFSGRARHGKTESCQAIAHAAARLHGKVAKLYDIGEMIRRVCAKEGRLPDVRREDMTPAQLQILINVGKEKRAVDVNYWVGELMQQIATDIQLKRVDVALCPNMRYENEAQAFRASGGHLVRLTRLNENGSVYISPDRPANDISETALEFWPCDYYIVTKEGQQDLLRAQAVALYRFLVEMENNAR